jgi:hypothetical protein
MLPGMSTHNGESGPGAVLASVSTATLTVWVVLAVAVGIALGLLGARLATGRRGTRPAPGPPAHSPAGDPAAPAAGGTRATAGFVDDLPGFLEHPPGAPGPAGPAPSALPTEPTAGPTTPAGTPRTGATTAAPTSGSAGDRSARSSVLAMVVAAVVLVVLATVVALTAGRDPAGTASSGAGPTGTTAPGTAPTGSAAPGLDPAVPTTAAPATATATAAAALAFTSLPLGDDGAAASVTFGGVVLEQRAVGLTVTYPSLSISTDGAQALAHVRLPTFNCLTGEPPADPVAAGCSRSLTEYSDLANPALRVSRDDDRLDLVGLFPTYTRSNGSPPAYTGRAYQLTATISPDGAVRGGAAAATGVVRIGLDSAASTPVPGVNVLQFAD